MIFDCLQNLSIRKFKKKKFLQPNIGSEFVLKNIEKNHTAMGLLTTRQRGSSVMTKTSKIKMKITISFTHSLNIQILY